MHTTHYKVFFAIKDKIFSCIRSWLLMKNDKVLLYDREINSNQLVHIHLLCFICRNNLNLSGLITNGINSLTDLSLMGIFFSEKTCLLPKHTFLFIKSSTTTRIKRSLISKSDRRGRDCMVVGFTTTYTISAYHH